MKNIFTIVFLVFFTIKNYSQSNNPRVSPVHTCTFSNNTISYVVGKIYVLPLPIEDKKVKDYDITVNNIQLYPNPVTNILNIETLDRSFVNFITISDVTGKTLYSNTLENNLIDISFLKRGIYIVKLDNDTTKTFKIIKN